MIADIFNDGVGFERDLVGPVETCHNTYAGVGVESGLTLAKLIAAKELLEKNED